MDRQLHDDREDVGAREGIDGGTGAGGAQSSIFGGRNGQDAFGGIDANRAGWWNRIKDSFLRSYEDEFIELIKLRADTTLHPSEIAAIVAERMYMSRLWSSAIFTSRSSWLRSLDRPML